ncbi:hypothetical protein PRIPAC_91601 [Pristionchus pacificus]|uniref:Uncharacterized protein n=1 Tax=Pristionchus pacificus TaxID=54126 RepID=A0A2A6CHA6_PRIPA|nr:hypothetical protein PRIPAC_91601 [Pristionchus pacificus]|eukprot:PDM77519.1 hypothetical protein PRIPAC_34386 [Pristionchus pacificus]
MHESIEYSQSRTELASPSRKARGASGLPPGTRSRGPSWHRPSRKARGASGDFRLDLDPTSFPPETRSRGPSWHRPSRKARGASGDPKKKKGWGHCVIGSDRKKRIGSQHESSRHSGPICPTLAGERYSRKCDFNVTSSGANG